MLLDDMREDVKFSPCTFMFYPTFWDDTNDHVFVQFYRSTNKPAAHTSCFFTVYRAAWNADVV